MKGRGTPYHGAHDAELLEVLLAKNSGVGLHNVEELGDDRRHPSEEVWSGLPAQHPLQGLCLHATQCWAISSNLLYGAPGRKMATVLVLFELQPNR